MLDLMRPDMAGGVVGDMPAASAAPASAVRLSDVEMQFGTTKAIQRLSLDVKQGEFFSILGPSGCGKTTLLRLISGFLQPTAGQVFINGSNMQGVPSNMRATAMIFQSLALFPFITVAENVAFGLEARGVKKAERLLELIALPGYGNRMPSELSGGQRQRVAIARALAIKPEVLLLDEPLSALDLKLRQHMRTELRDLQKRTGVTFFYITHDQSEALAMSDRVAVMNAGALQQVGTPQQLYSHPETQFVASFVGETNAISGVVAQCRDGIALLEGPYGQFTGRAAPGLKIGMHARLFVRPEALRLQSAGCDNRLSLMMQRFDFEGAFASAKATMPSGATPLPITLTIPQSDLPAAPAAGALFEAGFSAQDAIILPDD